jgi:hypothetical protein
MYNTTSLSWLLEYENAPYPSCQKKFEAQKLFSFIHLELAAFTC